METTHRMRKTALAATLAVLFGMASSPAGALSLGRLTVQSALGEPLRAEIDIPEINAEEADSLKSGVASAEAFAAAGLEYNPAVGALKVSLQRRADGRAYLRLTSDKVVNDPFVDLVLEANWSSGRIVRDYTMLFDPPNLRAAAAAPAPTAAQITSPAAAAAPAPAPSPRPAAAPAPSEPVASAPRPAATRPAAAPAPAASAKAGSQVTVRPGDTASKIASANKAADVSLDQMLVAMLRANPDAFARNNLNRLKAGAVLNLPGSEQATEISKEEASRTVIAQSKDFGEFRRQLAGAAPAVPSNERQAQGKVQTQVDVKKPPAATPDKLTLTKPSAQTKAAEDKIAAERQAKEAAARAAELERNLAELNRVKAAAAASAAAAAAKPAPAASAPPVAAIKPPVPASAPATAVPGVPVGVPASAPAPVASKPVAPASAKPPVAKAPPKPVEEPSFVDGLMEDPLLLGGGLAGLLGLGGLAFYMSRRRKKAAPSDSSFLDSHLQPDSFFGASGGEQVDTSNESVATGSSMIYSPSQLDTGGDVDPVAEADVYLAYGRDQQAEEILKDALQVNPSRMAIHAKLADIYHKRGDVSAFNALASSAHTVSQGQGQEWEHIRGLGRELDRDNILYHSDAAAPAPAPAVAAPVVAAAAVAAVAAVAAAPSAPATAPVATALTGPDSEPANVDLDFDLDFDLEHGQAAPGDNPPSVIGVLHESDTTDNSEPMALYDAPSEAEESARPQLEMPPELAAAAATAPKIKSHTAVAAPVAAAPAFDMNSVSLDLNQAAPAKAAPVAEEADTDNLDPLSTKLALAKEFQSIGDTDGAHALAEEVFSQATGQLRADAKKFLTDLGFAQSGFASSTF